MESILEGLDVGVKLEEDSEEQSTQIPEYYKVLNDEVIQTLIKDKSPINTNITFRSGGKYKPTTTNKIDDYTLKDLQDLLNDPDEFDKPVYLTYANTAIKLRTPYGVRIMSFDPKSIKKSNSINYDRIRVLDKLINDNPDKIIVKNKLPSGLGYEQAQVDKIDTAVKDILKELPNQKDIELWIDFEPQGVNITRAEKIVGSGKADIALLNGEKEVYWISYKEGAYSKDGEVLSKIPFQQYGSLKTLYNTEFDGEMKEFGGYFNGLVKDFLDAIKGKAELVYKDIETINTDAQFFIDKNGKNIPYSKDIEWHKEAKFTAGDVKKAIASGPIDIVVIQSGDSFYNAFVKDDNIESQRLAGKAVYGVDFDFNNTDYSRENCNILLQSNGTVELNVITGEDGESITGLNIMMEGGTGNVIYHPNLPTKPDEPLYGYTPALNLRHTKNHFFVYDSGKGKKTVIIGGRFLIYPLGGISTTATEVTL